MIEEAAYRRHIFQNLDKYLRKILEVARKLDDRSEVYLFGSVAEGRYILSSDIDILVVTEVKPELILAEMWSNGVKDPFEIHVTTKDKLQLYAQRSKLIKI